MSRRSTGLSRDERRGVSEASLSDEDHHVEHEEAPDSSSGAHPKTHLVTHIQEFDAEGVNQFARRNGISRRQVYVEIRAGRLIASKVGSRTLITRENGLAWRRSLPTMPAAAAPRQRADAWASA